VQQIKIFKGLENDISVLETEINTWLCESKARVINMSGNIAPQSESRQAGGGGLSNSTFSPSDVVIMLLYETT